MDKVLDTGSLQFFHVGRSTGYDKYGTAIQSLEGRNCIFCIFIITRTQYHDVSLGSHGGLYTGFHSGETKVVNHLISGTSQEVDKLKEELKKITDKDIQINIFEVKKPELDAVIVANNIARQVEGKIAYRRAIKMAIANTMRMGAEGIKVLISGRLNGAEMARSEMYKEGRTPLHTFRADIDYCHAEALTKVGLLGIKVWICRGEVYGKRELAPNFTQSKENNRGGNGNNGGKNFRRKKNNNR